MNILHINKYHYFRAGAEAAYLRTADIFEARGHRSFFFSMHHPQNLPSETNEYFMPLTELDNDEVSLTDRLKIAGRILYSLKARKLLSELLDRHSVDVAHIHNIYHHISPSILHELKMRKIPVVMTIHDYKLICASYSMWARNKPCEDCREGRYFMAVKNRCVKNSFSKSVLCTLEMYLHHKILDIYKNVDVFISPSRFLKNKFIEMGFKKEIVCIPHPFDSRKFGHIKPDVRDVKGRDAVSVVYFGRLVPEKGLFTLIEAAEILLNSHKGKGIEFKIIGDGPIREELQKRVKAKGTGNLRLTGFKKGEDLFQEVKQAMIVVLPSEWYENSPVSVMESFAVGVPVVGARIGGIPELVTEHVTGLTFEPGNADDLVLKIEYMINNPDKTFEMGRNARAFAEKKLNAESYYEKLMEIYKQFTN